MEELPEVPSLRIHLHTANAYGIWTGGAKAGVMDAVQETSLLGGLRFWTGALLRAQGQSTCAGRNCVHDTSNAQKTCALCTLFGCTGLSRLFSLGADIPQKQTASKGKLQALKLSQHAYRDRNGRQHVPTYYLTKGYTGPLTLSLTVRRPRLADGKFALPSEVLTALFLMIEYGTLGAYDQYGCGLVRFATPEDRKTLHALCLQKATAAPASQGISLRDFFFFKGHVQPKDATTDMGEIRYRIRDMLRQKINADLRHWFCGTLDKNTGACGTNYAFTINKDGALYGWGHYPRTAIEASEPKSSPQLKSVCATAYREREVVLNAVRQVLAQKDIAGSSLVWRECDSERDSVARQPWPQFYTSLVKDSWRDA